jgi:hypothetical protein
VFRQVQESGLLESLDTGKGFLPDSVIGSITLEAPDARLTCHFLADEQQQNAQGKPPPSPIRSVRPALDRLCELACKESRTREGKQ